MADDDLASALEERLKAWHSVTDAPVIPDAPKDWLVTELDAWFLTTARTAMPRLLAALRAVLELHQPKLIYSLADDGNGKSLCGHPFGADTDAHFEADDGYWYCRDKTSGSRCSSCADEEAADLWEDWPCPTYQAITRALVTLADRR